MDATHLLFTFTLITHILTTLMWWVAGALMGLSRKASKHWMWSALCYGTGLLLTIIGEPDGHNSTLWLIAGVLLVLGGVSLRRGMQAFLKLAHTDQEQATVALTCITACLGVFLPLGWRDAGMALCCFSMCWLLGRMAWECFQPLKNEFTAAVAWTHTTLMGVALAVFGATGLVALVPHRPWPWAAAPTGLLHQVLILGGLTLSILSSFVLGYIVVIRLVKRLEHLSHHDGLTGLLNRRAIEVLLDREVQRLQRFKEPFSVLLVDIDHFKRINDRMGHAAGDAVLAAVASTLQAQAREVDRVARYGGEEFCVLLPHTVHEGAWLAAERLRSAVGELDIPWGDNTLSITISAGLACASQPNETLPMLLRRADEALYAAKASGRNLVIAAPPAQAAAA